MKWWELCRLFVKCRRVFSAWAMLALIHIFAVVGDVFEQVVAEDDVDRIIGQRDLLYVEMQVGQRAFEVGRDVLPRMPRKMGFQVAHDADLGRDVERAG